MQVLLGEVTQVNPEGQQIVFNGKAYSYDHLVLATGSGARFSAMSRGGPSRLR